MVEIPLSTQVYITAGVSSTGDVSPKGQLVTHTNLFTLERLLLMFAESDNGSIETKIFSI